jgi:tetratricopeptide (TPR) repeat protein
MGHGLRPGALPEPGRPDYDRRSGRHPALHEPEQALAKRVPIDHRTDIYSLGATLYEALALEPVFSGRDRQELLRQIAFEEPRPLRRLNKAVPGDLDTIILKALEKNPAERYATAQELADDLRRWLQDEPIRARRPTVVQRVRKWSQRHRAVVGAVAACLVVAAAMSAGFVGWAARDRTARRERAADVIAARLDEAGRLRAEGKWRQGKGTLGHSKVLLTNTDGADELWARWHELDRDLTMLERLDEAHLVQTAVKDEHFDAPAAAPLYAAAFEQYGLPVLSLEPREAGGQIAASAIARDLVAALVDWGNWVRRAVDRDNLWAVARLAEDDPARQEILQALSRRDWHELARLSKAPTVLDQSPRTVAPLGEMMARAGRADLPAAVDFLQRAQRRYPADFWINTELAHLCRDTRPTRLDEAIGYLRAAVAIDPESPGARLNLAAVLENKGDRDGAIAEYRKAIELKTDYALPRLSLAGALQNQGRRDEAMAEYRELLDLLDAHPPRPFTTTGGERFSTWVGWMRPWASLSRPSVGTRSRRTPTAGLARHSMRKARWIRPLAITGRPFA